jgi:hypothetical protein
MLTANCSNRRFKLWYYGVFLKKYFFAVLGQGPPGQAWGAGIDPHQLGRQRPFQMAAFEMLIIPNAPAPR